VVRVLLLDESAPLLPLTGPGGVGKTRLALAIAGDVAGQFTHAVAWIDLAPLANPELVPMASARALGLAPASDQPVAEALAQYLRPRQTLLLFDNCEHLAQPVADLVAPLLAACPAVQVLATSRAPLHLRGEHEISVAPLPLPSSDGGDLPSVLASNPAVRLFVERARAASAPVADAADFTVVASICRKLDGLPLAIELAASRTRVLSLPALRDRLERRLPELEGGPRDAPQRQRTVRDTIAWSYELLAAERQMFERLAAFSGGFCAGRRAVRCRTSNRWRHVAHLRGVGRAASGAAGARRIRFPLHDARNHPRIRAFTGPAREEAAGRRATSASCLHRDQRPIMPTTAGSVRRARTAGNSGIVWSPGKVQKHPDRTWRVRNLSLWQRRGGAQASLGSGIR
jgi:predicted ATPase